MKVIFSVEPIRHPMTGIGRYTFELASRLPGQQAVEDVKWYSGDAFVKALPDPTIPPTRLGAGIRNIGRLLVRFGLFRRAHALRARVGHRRALRNTQDYLYHGPNFYLPAAGGPAVVTIHDLSVLKVPQFHPQERVNFISRAMLLSISRASVILTPSEYIRREVADYFGLPLSKVVAVSLASGREFRPLDEEKTTPVLRSLNLRHGGYVLYAGTIEPRKNIERLIQAYAQLEPSLRRRYPLILAGHSGWNNDAIMERIRYGEREGWLRYLGYVPARVLPTLFAGARVVAFPSIYEGFGLPVLEGMASGVPVVCSNSSSLPEVTGGAAAMCHAEDIDGLADLLRTGIEDPVWRKQAIGKGLAQAGRFSWDRCTEETVEAYKLAC